MSKQIIAGGVAIGGGAPVTIQSMCNTHTEDAKATIAQIHALEEAGCEIVRVTVPTPADAAVVSAIKEAVDIPVVADIHFDYRAALAAIDAIALFEGGLAGLCDVTVAVTAPVEDRVRRLMRRDGIPEDYARRRIAAQLDDDTLSGRADYAIVNIFEEDLEPAVVKLDRIFSHEAARH